MVFTRHNIIRWNQGNQPFELSTNDADVAQCVEQVLRYWVAPSLGGAATLPARRQQLIKTPDGYLHGATHPELDNRLFTSLAPAIRSVETDAGMGILSLHRHFTTVHGALLAQGSHGILIVGPSHAGKSTLSCALWAAGWQLLADDVTLLNPATATATPLMRRVSLRMPSRALLGDVFWQRMLSATTCDETSEGYVFHPDELEGQSRARVATLRAIVFLNRRNAAPVGSACIAPVIPSQALLSLAPYTNTIRHTNLGETIQHLAPLVNAVPTYDMGRGDLPAMVATLDTLLQGVPA